MDNKDLLQLTPEHIKSKKEIGKLKNNRVFHIETSGGLNVIMTAGAVPDILALAPHKKLAKWLAQKKETEIEYNELEKSEPINIEHFKHLIPKYEKLTERARNLLKK